MKKNLIINIIILIFSTTTYAETYTYKCADNKNAMSPAINAKVSYDKKTALYTYKYKIKNKSDALVPISYLYLITFTNGTDIKSNKNWKFLRFNDDQLFWSSQSKPLSSITYKNGILNIPEGNEYDIQPGESVEGFEFKSPYPPGPVKIKFSGDPLNQYGIAGPDGKLLNDPDAVLDPMQIEELEKQIVNCPGYSDPDYDVDNPRDSGLVDVTIGPIPPNRVAAKLRMRKIKEKKWRGSYDSEHDIEVLPKDIGKIQVMLFGSRELDVTKIDLTSLTFGQGKAKPLKTVIINDFKDKDGEIDDDIKEHIKRNNVKHLLLEFNLDDIDIRCDADRALFLNGKIGTKDLFGGVRIKHGSCMDKKNNAKEIKKIKDHEAQEKKETQEREERKKKNGDLIRH